VHKVRVTVSGHARDYFPAEKLGEWFEVSGRHPVREILAGWGVSTELVMAVFIDDVKADLDAVPPPGAEILLITPPAGG
jgi:hypothetical protein